MIENRNPSKIMIDNIHSIAAAYLYEVVPREYIDEIKSVYLFRNYQSGGYSARIEVSVIHVNKLVALKSDVIERIVIDGGGAIATVKVGK